MKKLIFSETELRGTWIKQNDQICGDETCKRIKWLIEEVLIQLAISREFGAWEILFKDSMDDRLWEKFYPQGELQGGGPPALRVITLQEAKKKYDF